MSWGALLTTENGAPFITPESIPLALIGKQSVSIGGGTTITQAFPSGRPIIPFVCTTIDAAVTYDLSGNNCVVSVVPFGSGGVAHVYFFTIFEQTLPDWGIAIWDAQGVCVLTNETRVLTDIVPIGVSGDDGQSGYNINTSLAGKYGIIPGLSGLVTGVIMQGGTRPYQSNYLFNARWDGSSTVFHSIVASGAPSGPIQNVAYHNMRNRVFALNLANYD